MKTIMDLFYETYSPRQKFYGLTMSLKETGREHTIRIRKRDKEVIKVTEEDRTQCYHNATKELIRHFPIEQNTLNFPQKNVWQSRKETIISAYSARRVIRCHRQQSLRWT